jgi:hypothetical protein
MKIYKNKILRDVICDFCGKSCVTSYGDFEYAVLNYDWGYCSRKDGEKGELSICEDCFDKIMKRKS